MDVERRLGTSSPFEESWHAWTFGASRGGCGASKGGSGVLTGEGDGGIHGR